jgi:hypothetical protein
VTKVVGVFVRFRAPLHPEKNDFAIRLYLDFFYNTTAPNPIEKSVSTVPLR